MLIITMMDNSAYQREIDNSCHDIYHIISYQLPLGSEEVFEAIIELWGCFHEVIQLIDALSIDALEHSAVLIQLKIDGNLHCIQLTEVTANIYRWLGYG